MRCTGLGGFAVGGIGQKNVGGVARGIAVVALLRGTRMGIVAMEICALLLV